MHADFAVLVQRSIGIAQQTLDTESEFLPYLALLDQDHSVQIVQCDDPRVALAESSLIEQLAAVAEGQRYVARAVIYDALTSGHGEPDAMDAIAASLRHANGLQQLASMAYVRDNTGIRFGPIELQSP